MTSKPTPGPWNLVWWGNETFPYPLSILANNDGAWVVRGGEVASEADARLIARAPDLLAQVERLTEQRDELAGLLEWVIEVCLDADRYHERNVAIQRARHVLAALKGEDDDQA